MIDKNTMVTIRRRIADKMCKSDDFLMEMAAAAVEVGGIKTMDILTVKQAKEILGIPVED